METSEDEAQLQKAVPSAQVATETMAHAVQGEIERLQRQHEESVREQHKQLAAEAALKKAQLVTSGVLRS